MRPGNKISDERKALVKQHIESLATVSSHYNHAKSPFRKYLLPHSSIHRAYNAYVQWLNENTPHEIPVTEDYYRRVFVNEYNIRIEPPSVDECNICAKLNIEIKYLSLLKLTAEKQRDLQDLLVYIPMSYKTALQQAIRDSGNEVPPTDDPADDDFDFN